MKFKIGHLYMILSALLVLIWFVLLPDKITRENQYGVLWLSLGLLASMFLIIFIGIKNLIKYNNADWGKLTRFYYLSQK